MLALLLFLGGCATRPINAPITQVDVDRGYTFQNRQKYFKGQDNLVVLAFSGGGTRAAAFSYGVLEFLRRTEVIAPNGARARLLDAVGVITGVSGGSFTALAYGLYGEKMFADYDNASSSNVRANHKPYLIADVLGDLSSTSWGPFELWRSYDDPVRRRDFWRSNRATAPSSGIGHRLVDGQPVAFLRTLLTYFARIR
jgi:NTE family protein